MKTYTKCIVRAPRAYVRAAARVRARAMQLACVLNANWGDVKSKTKWGKPNAKNSFLITRDGDMSADYMKTCTTCIVRARARRGARTRARAMQLACGFNTTWNNVESKTHLGKPTVKISF